MKLTIIGGAGVRTLGFVRKLIEQHALLPIRVLHIQDISQTRLATIGRMIAEKARRGKAPFEVELTTDVAEAVRGAAFVYLAIREGGDVGRVIDERVPLRYGVLGQETIGPGGFAMALRTIPVLLRYARIIEQEAPDAWVVNFTNPASMITEALHRHSGIRVIGICDAPSSLKLDIARYLKTAPDDIAIRYFGLNHLGWIDAIRADGRERLADLVDRYEDFVASSPHMACFSPERIRALRLIPNEYLYYYYSPEEATRNILGGTQTRGQQVEALNRRLIARLQEELGQGRMDAAFEAFAAVMKERQDSYMQLESGQTLSATDGISAARPDSAAAGGSDDRPDHSTGGGSNDRLDRSTGGGSNHSLNRTSDGSNVEAGPGKKAAIYENEGYAGLALAVITAIHGERPAELIVNVPNRGTLAGLEDDDIVEVACRVDRGGPRPLPLGSVPEPAMRLIRQVKHYERQAVQAAATGSYETALAALASHPLVPSEDLAERMLNDYIREHGDSLAYFTERGS